MQQIWIPRIGNPDVLEVRQSESPSPGPGEVHVEVVASGVNFADLMARMGLYPDAPPLPAVVGYEISGRVIGLGEGAENAAGGLAIGDPVVAMCRFGAYSSEVVVPGEQIAKVPEGMDLLTAAGIPVTGLTAWIMLEVMGRVRAGDRVLVHSAGGGVGLMALDLLRWRGATAIGTASAGKHEQLRELGYDQLIDYRNEDFAAVLRDQPGLDLILDPVGGESWEKGLSLLRAGGRLVCYGMSANATGDSRSLLSVARSMWAVPWRKINPITLMNENKGVMGVNMGHMWHERERVGGWLRELMALWQQGVLRPHIHAKIPFAEASRAHALIHARENFGKVLLVTDPADATPA